MNIVISDKWSLRSDPMNWILEEFLSVGESKDGTPTRNVRQTFHGSLQQACEALIEKDLRQSDITDLKTIIREVDRVHQEIYQMLSQLQNIPRNHLRG